MTDELNENELERQIDGMLGRYADRLTVPPPAAVVQRVKSAVRQELNESWLADLISAPPSAEAVERTQQAVRAELRRVRLYKRLRRWSPLAAAALMAICVGILQYNRPTKPAAPDLDFFVQAAEDVFTEDPTFVSLHLDLEQIEENMVPFFLSVDYEQETLDTLGDEIDGLFREPELDWMSQTNHSNKRALG